METDGTTVKVLGLKVMMMTPPIINEKGCCAIDWMQKEHPNEQPDPMINAKQAADTWKSMTPEEKIPFERMFQVSNVEDRGVADPEDSHPRESV